MTKKGRLLLGLAALCLLALGWDWWRHGGKALREATPLTGTLLTPAQQEALAPFVADDAQVMVVHFWATWCPPCMVEMPQVLSALETVPSGIAVAMVSLDDPSPSAFYAQQGLTVKPQARGPVSWLDDPQHVRAKALLGKVVLPVTLLVAPDTQRVLARIDGPLSWPPLMAVLRNAVDHNQGNFQLNNVK